LLGGGAFILRLLKDMARAAPSGRGGLKSLLAYGSSPQNGILAGLPADTPGALRQPGNGWGRCMGRIWIFYMNFLRQRWVASSPLPMLKALLTMEESQLLPERVIVSSEIPFCMLSGLVGGLCLRRFAFYAGQV